MDANTKIKLHSHCLDLLDDRIKEARNAIEEIQQAANNETKSSAGDKYETGRAMMQQEQDKWGRQLMEHLKQRAVFDQLKPELALDKVQPGALVRTDNGSFYIAASLGAVHLNGTEYVVISTAAPLYQQMKGKQQGQEVSFNSRNFLLEFVI